MPTPVALRPYRPDDEPAVADIITRAFRPVSIDARMEDGYGLLNGTTWDQRKIAAVGAEIAAYPAGAFVAEAEGQVLGFITTSVDPNGSIGRIINLAVVPEAQGQGVGKALLCQAFDHLRAVGVQYFRIETTENNAVGQALYPRCGFREISRQIIYFRSAQEAAAWTHSAPDEAPS